MGLPFGMFGNRGDLALCFRKFQLGSLDLDRHPLLFEFVEIGRSSGPFGAGQRLGDSVRDRPGNDCRGVEDCGFTLTGAEFDGSALTDFRVQRAGLYAQRGSHFGSVEFHRHLAIAFGEDGCSVSPGFPLAVSPYCERRDFFCVSLSIC